MVSIFESKKKKNIKEFIRHLSLMQTFILESLKKDFPEEVIWLLSNINNKKINDAIPSVVIAFYSILGAISKSQEKQLCKELNKSNLLNEYDTQELISFWASAEKVYSPDGKITSVENLMEFSSLVLGDYLCAKAESYHEESIQPYEFSDEFRYHLGCFLFAKFNNILKLIDSI